MAGYSPLKITGMQTGLVQEREEFLLPDDAYPKLQNAYVWRERIKRKRGCQLLGRLRRKIDTTDAGGNKVINILPVPITSGIASFQIGSDVFTDPGGASPVNLLTNSVTGSAILNRAAGTLTIALASPLTDVYYYPGLPVMGARIQEQNNSANDQTIFFDQVYAYIFDSVTAQFKEFIPNTTWNASNQPITGTDFFWSTNYFTSTTGTPFTANNNKLFWVTNNTGFAGATADPPRITDGIVWVDFFPAVVNPGVNDWSKIDSTNYLTNWLAMLPFRGRMVTFNTWEGSTAGNSINYRNRIRWSTIGNPFIPYTAGPPARGSWRSDIRGQGGFLDIPTNEDIISVGFVRDNLVIYCERSTWQLRYTGRSIAPFQIEKVNSELGAEGPFSTVQFDTSLVGIGDKGIVECDSYKSERIDVKIPDFVFQFQSPNNGVERVHGIRDFVNRLAYWTIPLAAAYPPQITGVFPNQRLVYNYENDSWALFDDSFTVLGNYQTQNSRTWLNTPLTWLEADFSWINEPVEDPVIVAGNQQGFVEIIDQLNFNDVSLAINNITSASPSVLYIPSHNLNQESIISISGIPTGSPYSDLNGGVFGVEIVDSDNITLTTYDSESLQFSEPVDATPSGTYQGVGYVSVRDNFSIKSKKFNFLDEGQNIQIGYLDILMEASETANPGAISLKVYLDYNDSTTANTLPENDLSNGFGAPTPDQFFNATIPTTSAALNNVGGTKFWQRVYCPTRSNFITLEYTFSNEQMSNNVFKTEVQIDAQILWIRKAGRMTQI